MDLINISQNTLVKVFYFNFYFVSGTAYNINEEIEAVFITKSHIETYDLNLIVLLKDKSSENTLDMSLAIAQDFEERLFFNPPGDIKTNFFYENTYHTPLETDVLCCLFAWNGKYSDYNFINFVCSLNLQNICLNDKLQATLVQMLVNRIHVSTRNIRYLYDSVKKHITITFFHYSNNYEEQYFLIEDMLVILSNIITITFNIVNILFYEEILYDIIQIKQGEISLFGSGVLPPAAQA